MTITDSTDRPRYATDPTAAGFRRFVATLPDVPHCASRRDGSTPRSAKPPHAGRPLRPAAGFRYVAARRDERIDAVVAADFDLERLYPTLFARVSADAPHPSVAARFLARLSAAMRALWFAPYAVRRS